MLGRCARGPEALLVGSMWQLRVHSTVSRLVCVKVALLPLEQPLESNKMRFGFQGGGWTTSRGFTTASLEPSGATRCIWAPMLTISYEYSVVMLQNQRGRVAGGTDRGGEESSPEGFEWNVHIRIEQRRNLTFYLLTFHHWRRTFFCM